MPKKRSSDYFFNHEVVNKFPWSIYHAPIKHDLLQFLHTLPANASILVVGPGAFEELVDIPPQIKISVVDNDPRVLAFLEKKFATKIQKYILASQNSDLQNIGDYDAIYAKEVIEHLTNPGEFLANLLSNLKKDGKAWFSTPNYGWFLLPLLENTFLEWIARRKGSTRKDIHPTKFSVKSLNNLLVSQNLKIISLKNVALGMAITAVVQK